MILTIWVISVNWIGKLVQAKTIWMAFTLLVISVKFIETLMQAEKKLNGINYIDYIGKLDWKISAGCETI